MTSGRTHKTLVVTAGEPSGIGPEICLALVDSPWAKRLVFIADADMLSARADLLGMPARIMAYEQGSSPGKGELAVLHQPLTSEVQCGQPDTANARSLLDGLERAAAGCMNGEFAALVTAPIQKSVINDAGISFTGHTEFLAALTGCPVPVMLLVAGELRVALASTHLPLRDVPGYLTTDGIVQVLRVLHADLANKFHIDDPQIVVCGLNPHAGEGGHLGNEDMDIIAPAVAACVAQGMQIRGPLPADTAFTPSAGHADAVLAMYHDQGLPVVKYAGFGDAVNVTLGLPIIRTSVDHGTALDIAGSGTANPGSLFAAVSLAAELSKL